MRHERHFALGTSDLYCPVGAFAGGPGFAALVPQSQLGQLPRRIVHHRDLLVACVKITTCNSATAGSAPFLRALVVEQQPNLLGGRSRRRHLISPTSSCRCWPVNHVNCRTLSRPRKDAPPTAVILSAAIVARGLEGPRCDFHQTRQVKLDLGVFILGQRLPIAFELIHVSHGESGATLGLKLPRLYVRE